MNYGLYVSASGVLTGMRRLDVASNNLANVNTPGFKPDVAFSSPRPAERVEDQLFSIDSDRLMEAIGGGVLSAPTRTSFRPGPAQETGNALDVAILGEGFFVLEGAPGSGGDGVRFTRDGRFTLGERGRIVSAATGLPALGEGDAPIEVDPSRPVSIDPGGFVRQGADIVGRLQVATVADPAGLRKTGENLFVSDGNAGARRPADAVLRAGFVEGSAVEPIRAMLAVQSASGDVRRNARIMQIHDELMNRAINTFGRIG